METSHAPARSSQRAVSLTCLRQVDDSNYFFLSQPLGIHTSTEVATTLRRRGTVPLAMKDISIMNMVEDLIRNLTVISSN